MQNCRLLSILCCLLLAISCAHKPYAPDITMVENSRLQFSGKGAGAGMMLMSTMGPMGIAIGIAIDEGIAKEIRETATAGGVDITELLRNSLRQHKSLSESLRTISITRYGFMMWSGSNDVVIPEFHFTAIYKDGSEKSIAFPKDFIAMLSDDEKKNIEKDLAPLTQVKKESAEIQRLFAYAIEKSLAYIQ